MAQKNGLSYSVSRNGSAGDWYWEVMSDSEVIARGLAPTRSQAYEGAMKAAASHLDHVPFRSNRKLTSWPGLSRPPTSSFEATKDVAARDERGHGGGESDSI